MIIDTLQNQKLATYYKGNEISNSLKSMIHVNTIITYKIQLPDKVWDLIKQFMIYDKEYYKVVMESENGYIIKNGKFFTIPRIFNNARLTSLDLDDNQITDITALTNALSTNTTLTVLSLSGNQITDITALANALLINTTLTVLILSGNQITDITALANALLTNTTLTVLILSRNQITDIHGTRQRSETNTKLIELHLWENQITDITALGNALNTNSTINRIISIRQPNY